MALKLYGETDVQNIADEIRFYNEKEDKYRVEDMTLGIQDIAENIEDNLGTVKTVEGENNLSYEDTKDYRIQEATYQGNVEQDTLSGKNQIKIRNISGSIDGITYSIEDDVITFNGTATKLAIIDSDVIFNLSSNLNKRLTVYPISGTWTGSSIGINYRGADNYQKGYIQILDTNTNTTTYRSLNADTPEITPNDIERINFYATANATFNNFKFKIQLEDNTTGATSTITDYEKYCGGTAAPNPDYPMDVRTVRSWNLFNIEDSVKTNNGYTIEVKNNIIHIYGSPQSTSSTYTALSLSDGKGISYQWEAGTYTLELKNRINGIGLASYLNNDINITMAQANNFTTKTLAKGSGTGYPVINVSHSLGKIDLYLYPQLTKSPATKPYLPYNSIGIKRTGKNLWPYNNAKYTYSNASWCYVDGKAGAYGTTILDKTDKKIKIKKGTYTFSVDSFTNASTIQIVKTGEVVLGGQINSSNKSVTFTLPNDEMVTVRIYNSTANVETTVTGMMLSKEGGNYEPYTERIDYIDLQGNELCKIGDVKDELKVDDKGNVKLIKRIGKVVLDGRESFSNNAGYINGGRFAINNYTNGIKGSASQPGAISTHFNGKFETSNGSIFLSGVDNLINFIFVDYANKLDDLRTWLSQNKPIVYYILATPQEINLGKIKVKSLEGLNNVSILAEVEPTVMNETYMLDTQSKYLPKVTTEDAKIDYVAQFPLDVKTDGNTYQETTTGKNILPNNALNQTINGVTFTKQQDGSVLVNGTATADANYIIFGTSWSSTDQKISLEKGQSYVLSLATANAILYSRDAVNNKNYSTPLNGTKRFDDMEYITMVYIQVPNGRTATNEIVYPMIEKNTIYTSYEPYTNGASPNPDYPQSIETVKSWNILKYNDIYVPGYKTTKNGITLEVKDDLSFDLKGTSTATTEFFVVGSWGIKNNSFISPQPITLQATGLVDGMTSNFAIFNNGTNVTNKGLTYTTTSAIINLSSYTYDGISQTIQIASGKTINTTVKLQTVYGSATKPYLPYNNIGVKIVGKNIIPNEAKNQTINGIQYTINGDKSITCVGTATSISDLYLWGGSQDNGVYLEIPQGEYALSSVPDLFFVRTKDDGVLFKAHLVNTLKTKSVKIFGIVLRINQNSSVNTTYCPQLEQGSVATDYEPHKELTSYIDLQGNEVCKIGDVKDELKVDNKGNVKLIKRIGKVVLDGITNKFTYQDQQNYPSTLMIPYNNRPAGLSSPTSAMSTHFPVTSGIPNYNAIGWGQSTQMWIRNNGFTSLENGNNWLKENNVEVYYQLKEPQEIDLGKVKIIPFEGTNNIEVLAELEPSKMETTYYIDAKKYIEDMTNTLLDFGGES